MNNRVEFQRDQETDRFYRGKPGTWALTTDGSVVMTCPVCGNAGTIGTHSIADDGTVSPSIVCANGGAKGCSFHEFVRLAEWEPWPEARR